VKIKIEVVEVLVKGEKRYEIGGIKALKYQELPAGYTAMEGAVHLDAKERLLIKESGYYKVFLSRGQVIDLRKFEEICFRVKFAGEMLKKQRNCHDRKMKVGAKLKKSL
jgi:hypothetical protein